MNCNNVRKYFHAFLDGELDVEKNIEVLAHLDLCVECSAKIESERSLQERVKDTVCMVKAPAYLKQAILEKATVDEKPGLFILIKEYFLNRKVFVPITGIAVVLILIAFFFTIQGNWMKNDVLSLAESTYHNYLMKQLKPDILTQDAESIVKYFREKTGMDVTLPGIKDDARLVGAAMVNINNSNVPLVFYMYEDTPMALFINCKSGPNADLGTSIDFSKMKEFTTNKMVVYADTGDCGSCRIYGWKDDDNQYIMVSMLKSDKMIRILTEV